ncbi:MAG: ribose 5-phosphate isomerase A [Gammaproteobacteria bacterium RIFCSPHIGHO2_12_FULL_41_20]|nr:MAG: ribose 5-phosphate isomerase A [Gammaproteobacteria bacterium RIFCSPHIGHO2_12_FULL_41_20]
MDAQAMKKAAAEAALEFIQHDSIIGVGSGTTVDCFIAALKSVKNRIEGAVASSEATASKLRSLSIPLVDLNSLSELSIYVDGADEINEHKKMIKGGGGALTREKIIATMAKKFVCIADESKYVDLLGTFPVAVEVIPMARSYVGRQIVKMGGDPVYRQGFTTDNGNVILDVYNLKILDPLHLEQELKGIVGVVENGIFARRPADVLLLATPQGVRRY